MTIKQFAVFAVALMGVSMVEAGTISRTYTYSDGNTISANENNTNENTLYNEINGNIDSANIENGSILNEDIADTQFTRAKFAATVQSTFTYIDTLGAYRRPRISYISATTIDVENNTGTASRTCIQFPDERRCVTEDTSSTSVNRRFIITETASVSGTKNSGLFAGESEGVNLWYALYAVKTTDVATDFVIVGSTKLPTVTDFATLNTNFGTNSWVYLGMIRNGDNSGSTGNILNFSQSGNTFVFRNETTGAGVNGSGIRLATNTGGTTLTYTGASGVGTTQYPEHCSVGYFHASSNGGASVTSIVISPQVSATLRLLAVAGTGTQIHGSVGPVSFADGLIITPNNTTGFQDIFLRGWLDQALGVGFNPTI